MELNEKVELLKQQIQNLTNEVFKNLEIVSLGNRIKTGKDASVILNGKPIHGYLGIAKVNWDLNPKGVSIKFSRSRTKIQNDCYRHMLSTT